ncbi:hypothetical protein Rt10032_c23g6669 [Rhodotorula toruloides]|uniref:Chromatin target of PRMT1 protein C-terminal domain-containing protein n=1 Tax=Rhodotorula toruloides TaxID=5286 RepID=A0A511KQK7_RHOTO|nr:hypothetical protein Rt10032_c23g6669 [Rhodotorula toruloides]
MASLLERTLGAVRKETGDGDGNRRVSGGGRTRGSPYARPGNDSWKHDKFDAHDESRGGGSRKSAPRTTPALTGSASTGASAKLIIKNVHYEVSERELEVLPVSELDLLQQGQRSKYGCAPLLFLPDYRSRDPWRLVPGTAFDCTVDSQGSLTRASLPLPLISPSSPPRLASSTALSRCSKFDRSGRSEGIAWVTYTNEKHAAQAKEAFNGAPAKGQPLEIEFDYRVGPPPGPAAPGTLLARLGHDGRGPKSASSAPRAPGIRHASGGAPTGPRSEHGISSTRGGSRAGARGGRGGAGGPRGGDRVRKDPKTADDLDKELEAFMKAPESKTATLAAAPSGDDVEMA